MLENLGLWLKNVSLGDIKKRKMESFGDMCKKQKEGKKKKKKKKRSFSESAPK